MRVDEPVPKPEPFGVMVAAGAEPVTPAWLDEAENDTEPLKPLTPCAVIVVVESLAPCEMFMLDWLRLML